MIIVEPEETTSETDPSRAHATWWRMPLKLPSFHTLSQGHVPAASCGKAHTSFQIMLHNPSFDQKDIAKPAPENKAFTKTLSLCRVDAKV
jgi:hypothetical protein